MKNLQERNLINISLHKLKKTKMKNPDLYNKTVNILYQEYFNDTLRHANPCACAVGNLVKYNMGYDDSWDNEKAK